MTREAVFYLVYSIPLREGPTEQRSLTCVDYVYIENNLAKCIWVLQRTKCVFIKRLHDYIILLEYNGIYNFSIYVPKLLYI